MRRCYLFSEHRGLSDTDCLCFWLTAMHAALRHKPDTSLELQSRKAAIKRLIAYPGEDTTLMATIG